MKTEPPAYGRPQLFLAAICCLTGFAFALGLVATGASPLGDPVAARLQEQWGERGVRYLEATTAPGLLALELAPERRGELIAAENPQALVKRILGAPADPDLSREAHDAALLVWHGAHPSAYESLITPIYAKFDIPGLIALARWGDKARLVFDTFPADPALRRILTRYGPELVIPVVHDYYTRGSWVAAGERSVAAAVKQTVATYRWIRASISSKPYPVQEKQEPPVDPQVDAAARCIAWIDTDGLDFLNEFRVDPTTGAVARKPAMTLMTQLAFPATRGMIDRVATGNGWSWAEAAWSAVEILPWTGLLALSERAGARTMEAAWTAAGARTESAVYRQAVGLLEREYGPVLTRKLLGLGAEAPLMAGYARIAGPGFLRSATTIGSSSLRAVELEGPGAARRLGALSRNAGESLAGADVDAVRLALREGTEEACTVARRFPKVAPALLELPAADRGRWMGRILRWGWPAARLATLYVVVTHPLATLQSLYQLANFLHIPPWITVGTALAIAGFFLGQFLWFPIWLGFRIFRRLKRG